MTVDSDCIPCTAGGFCREGALAPTPCGDDAFYCPAGAAQSEDVGLGYYAQVWLSCVTYVILAAYLYTARLTWDVPLATTFGRVLLEVAQDAPCVTLDSFVMGTAWRDHVLPGGTETSLV
jgi:hypothetical protein